MSCHAILEYDELKLFEELGIDYVSLGSYLVPRKPVDPIRPPLNHTVSQEILENVPDRDNIPKEFFDKFDVIVIMHVPEWIEKNWDKMKHKKVIWRTIGQSTKAVEERMAKYRREGMKIVRYSPKEANIERTAGCDKIIRFYKDPDEFGHWVGAGNEVITIAQDMQHRGEYCNYDAFMELAEGFNAKLYGPKNEESVKVNGGFLTYEQMKQKMRDARVYIYTGTQPASYTLNLMEAMMTGVPIVALGPKHGNSLNLAGDLYEIPEIIANGVNGFWSDDLTSLRETITFLLKDKKSAERIGRAGRERAIELFGKDAIKEQWRKYLTETLWENN